VTVDEILKTDAEITAAALKTAFNGIYVNEMYKDRAVLLEKTDTAYIVRFDNPRAEFLPNSVDDAVEIIKRELGNLPS
jgi:hypothetical protein